MDIIVDGKAPRPFTAKDRKRMGKLRAAYPCEGTALSVAEGLGGVGRWARVVNIIMGLLVAMCLALFAVLEIMAADSFTVYAGLVFLPVAGFVGLAWRIAARRSARLGPQLAESAKAGPPPGTRVVASEAGLAVGGRELPWAAISLARLGGEMMDSGDAGSYLRPDRLWLSFGGEDVLLDRRLLRNGLQLVSAVCNKVLAD